MLILSIDFFLRFWQNIDFGGARFKYDPYIYNNNSNSAGNFNFFSQKKKKVKCFFYLKIPILVPVIKLKY